MKESAYVSLGTLEFLMDERDPQLLGGARLVVTGLAQRLHDEGPLDRLEVRGRDSAGIHVFVSDHGVEPAEPPLAQQRLELAVRDGRAGREGREHRLEHGQEDEEPQHVPDEDRRRGPRRRWRTPRDPAYRVRDTLAG